MLNHPGGILRESKKWAPLAPDGSGVSPRSGEKLERLLAAAATLMADQGYSQTSIRNVARATGFSLAGMYYYFENKEDLLFQIQHRTFAALLTEQEQVAKDKVVPEEKLRRLVQNHLSYFTHHFNELKVCTFELQKLQGERYREIEGLRRRYFRCQARVVAEVLGVTAGLADSERTVRHYTLFIFGMLNWIFMWYDANRDEPVDQLGEEMMKLIMNGLRGTGAPAD
jgi:TetR/AcrR family transcriptional regulator